jgi:hypothetical protein
MTTQEKIDFIRSKVEEGKVVYYILPDQMAVSTLEELCDQPADGILYDLNRDEASILAFAGDDNPYWVNNLAASQVIRYLKGRVEELEAQKRNVINGFLPCNDR